MADFKPYFEVKIPFTIEEFSADAIAEDIIEYIKQRTEDGKDKNEKAFKPYSKAYAEYKGVSPQDVDLELSSEMLNALEYRKKGRTLQIGYFDDSILGKVEGNVLGTYGDENRANKKPRDFLGIKKEKLIEILSEYVQEGDTFRGAPQVFEEDAG